MWRRVEWSRTEATCTDPRASRPTALPWVVAQRTAWGTSACRSPVPTPPVRKLASVAKAVSKVTPGTRFWCREPLVWGRRPWPTSSSLPSTSTPMTRFLQVCGWKSVNMEVRTANPSIFRWLYEAKSANRQVRTVDLSLLLITWLNVLSTTYLWN